jgi:hypothetical protein
MSNRHVIKTVAFSGAASICGLGLAFGLGSGVAGASLVSGDGSTTLSTTGTVTSGTPYTNGQDITVTVGANSTLSTAGQTGKGAPAPNGNYYFEECSDPGGTTTNLPTTFSGCEAGTIDIESGNASTGAVTASDDFPVYALPDVGTVGGPTMTGSCGTAPNYCVIGIFADNPNFGHSGFADPHLFSAPFQVVVGDGQEAGDNPGDGTPEVPLAIGLPVAALGIFGIVLVRRNRRRHTQAA